MPQTPSNRPPVHQPGPNVAMPPRWRLAVGKWRCAACRNWGVHHAVKGRRDRCQAAACCVVEPLRAQLVLRAAHHDILRLLLLCRPSSEYCQRRTCCQLQRCTMACDALHCARRSSFELFFARAGQATIPPGPCRAHDGGGMHRAPSALHGHADIVESATPGGVTSPCCDDDEAKGSTLRLKK